MPPTTSRTYVRAQWGLGGDAVVSAASVCEITRTGAPLVKDRAGTLADARMGPAFGSDRVPCATCGRDYWGCPGHFGSAQLHARVIPHHFLDACVDVLQRCCAIDGCRGVRRGARCGTCSESMRRVRTQRGTDILVVERKRAGVVVDSSEMHPDDVLRAFHALSREQVEACGLSWEHAHPARMVWSCILVLPPSARPYHKSGHELSADKLTRMYNDVLEIVAKMRVADTVSARFLRNDLYRAVSSLCDGDGAARGAQRAYADRPKYSTLALAEATGRVATRSRGRDANDASALLLRLKGKKGRFRLNIMGGTVDFSARAVITGGAHLRVDEVGVPFEIANALTRPERVTTINAARAARLAELGRVRKIGRGKDLFECPTPYEPLIGDVVHRCLENGDVVVINRQPTLHRHSLMGFKCVVVPFKSIRLNPAVCKAFNADFDGDEMNLHVPQSELARAEAEGIMNVRQSVLSSQKALPVAGLMMDALLAAHALSHRSCFLDEYAAADFLMESGMDAPVMPPPTVFTRGRTRLWSGAAMLSALLPPHFDFGEDPDAAWFEKDVPVVRGGVLLGGTLTKSHVGAASDSFVHRMHLQCAEGAAIDWMTATQRACNWYASDRGFSIGLADTFLPERSFDDTRRVREAARAAPTRDIARLEAMRNELGDECIVAMRARGDNPLVQMATCGSKGQITNVVSMCVALGTQSVNGDLPPLAGLHGRRSVRFPASDESCDAAGFVSSSFLVGLRPHEYVYNAMWGRVALADSATKTPASGYTGRGLVKTLEDFSIKYDGTVRDARGRIAQYKYGGTGFAPDRVYSRTCTPLDRLFLRRASETEDDSSSSSFVLPDLPARLAREWGLARGVAERACMLALAPPGEPVGCHAAHCISEPTTQMSLGTYHLAGSSSKRMLGIKRIEELLRCTSKDSAAVVEIPCVSQGEADALGDAFDSLTLRDVTVRAEFRAFDRPSIDDRLCAACFGMPRKRARESEGERRWAATFWIDSRRITASEAARALAASGEHRVTRSHDVFVHGDAWVRVFFEAAQPYAKLKSLRACVLRGSANNAKHVDGGNWVAEKGVYEVQCRNSRSAAVVLRRALRHSPKSRTTSVYATFWVLGAQAARNCLVDELASVFSADGASSVAPHHLLLLGDVAIMHGLPLGTSRSGGSAMSGSSLKRVAYEDVCRVAVAASLRGEHDECDGVSARIVLAARVPVGTGAEFDILNDFSYVEEEEEEHDSSYMDEQVEKDETPLMEELVPNFGFTSHVKY